MTFSHLECFLRLKISTLVSIPSCLSYFPYIMSHNSGYWQLSMHPEHRKYLGISVIDPETKQTLYFEWNVMFLGISDAVFIFVSIHS